VKLDALFFAAHPDDAELSCGGIIAKFAKFNKKAGIIDLTQGELGTRGSTEIRKKEASAAAKILNVSVRENLKIPDGNIENTTLNRLKVITVIRNYRPEVIFFPHYYDRHPDHYNTHHLVKDAAFYSGLLKVKTTFNKKKQTAYRPKRNYYYMQTYAFEPNIVVDISEEFKVKMKAISCYSSQFYNPKSKEPESFVSDKKFIEFIKARSEFHGFQIGVKYGEPLYTEEKLNINITNLLEI
jgi:bacillithiol biosynthesis deacetylase BshB1